MLAVGILGGPVIGKMAEDAVKQSVIAETNEETYGKISKDSTYFLGDYTAVELAKVDSLEGDEKDTVKHSIQVGKQASLASVAIFPVFMLMLLPCTYFLLQGTRGLQTRRA